DYNFKLYKAIESSYDYIVLNAVKELLVKLFVQNSIPYLQEKPFHFTMIKNGKKTGKKTGYNLTYDIEAASPKKQSLIRDCEENDVDCVNAIILGSVGKDDTTSLVETWNQWYEKNSIPVQQITLQNFFDYWFGIDEYEIFMVYVNGFNERAKNLISFNTVLMPTEEVLEKFRFSVSTMLLEYPYRDLIPNEIFVSQIDILHRNYFNRGLYKAMVGEGVFAESFISSEWLYNIDKVTGCIDKTGIVAGYLKSVEQLLFAVIQLSKDRGKTIRARDKTIIEYTSDNEDRIDSTLGALAAFVDHNSSVLNVSNYVKHHMVETIDDWREKQRNGYFHKDNLRDFKKVDEIRQEAIYLYFLVLGGFSIDDAQFDQLGIYNEKSQTSGSIKTDLQYKDFDEWLSPMLRYDIPKEAVAVYFTLRLKHNNSWALQLAATSRFDEKDCRWLSETVFFSIPDLSDWQSDLTIEKLQTRVIDYIKRYWDTGEYSKKLKEFEAVAFWHKDNVEIIYKK
ncbi:hypothetical protein LJC63_06575, partial [Ruminococcaceae bacterium OttesenSCG-928-L11]|nr:hypothetical protein [Ruminococcaceae bacterium OttesenSCG-928-L11]